MLHGLFRELFPAASRRSALTTAKWSLTLIWTFLALRPGAVLGNTFFTKPMFVEGEASLGVPSLWVWQVVFWFIGVLLVWWLAYRGRMGVLDERAIPRIALSPPADPLGRRRAPEWLALMIARVSSR